MVRYLLLSFFNKYLNFFIILLNYGILFLMKENTLKEKRNKKFIWFIILQSILFLILIFLTLGVAFNFPIINKLDNFIFSLCEKIRSKPLNNIMLFFTLFGETYFIIAVLICLLFFKNKKISFSVLSVTALSAGINYIIKNIIQRARPTLQFINDLVIDYKFPTSYSFPSGHSQTSFVLYFILGYLLLNKYYKGKYKKLFLSLITVLPILVMFSRIILGVHYFTDVLAGAIIGVILISNFIYFTRNNSY